MKSSAEFMALRNTVYDLVREEALKAMQHTPNRAMKPRGSQTKNMTFGGLIKTTFYDLMTLR
jgi:hypothetical protein